MMLMMMMMNDDDVFRYLLCLHLRADILYGK